MIGRLIHAIERFIRPMSIRAFAEDEEVMRAARTLVAYYYYVLPFLAALFYQSVGFARPNFDPRWPLDWANWLSSVEMTGGIVSLLFFGSALLGVFLHPYRIVRVLVFIGIWQVHALESSFGPQASHQYYTLLYTSAIFIFLPDIWLKHGLGETRVALIVIWWAQAFCMLTYTMAGVYKMIGVATQFAAGEIHGFSVHAFAYQIADWLPKLQSPALLGPFVIEYPYAGWPLYVGLHFAQLFALWVMVRPSLQKIWGLLFVMFHIGTMLFMGISFIQNIMVLSILFFNSPFALHTSFRQILRDLPLIGFVFEWFERRNIPRLHLTKN